MAVFFGIDSLPSFKQTVITIGTFDGVHKGHQKILAAVKKSALEAGGESIVITFEPHPRKLLYPDQSLRLLTPLEDKISLIQAEGIDHIIVAPFTQDFAALSAEDYVSQFLVKHFAPKRIVIGYDHHFGHDRSGNITLLRSLKDRFGYEIEELPAQLIEEATVSSTKIRNALTEGEIRTASQMLGREYDVSGKVVEGAKLGRTIGYPTANIEPLSSDQLIPAHGIYAVQTEVGGITYNGMMSIGFNPTVTSEKKLAIEVHIFNFNRDIYHQPIRVSFFERLRDEARFPSLEALRAQIELDEINTRRIFGTS